MSQVLVPAPRTRSSSASPFFSLRDRLSSSPLSLPSSLLMIVLQCFTHMSFTFSISSAGSLFCSRARSLSRSCTLARSLLLCSVPSLACISSSAFLSSLCSRSILLRRCNIASLPLTKVTSLTLIIPKNFVNRRLTFPFSSCSKAFLLFLSARMFCSSSFAFTRFLSSLSFTSTRSSTRLRRSMKIECPCGPLLS
eukprot:scaffold168_cov64-Phaeocystis_antarctica.AAC.4